MGAPRSTKSRRRRRDLPATDLLLGRLVAVVARYSADQPAERPASDDDDDDVLQSQPGVTISSGERQRLQPVKSGRTLMGLPTHYTGRSSLDEIHFPQRSLSLIMVES